MPDESGATGWAALRHRDRSSHLLVSQVLAHKGDLGDDLTPFLHRHEVSLVEVQVADEVLIIECRTGDGGTGELYRLQQRHRCDDAASPGLVANFQEPRNSLLGIVLIGDRPLRTFCRHPDPLMEGVVVDLQHHPVSRHLQLVPVEIPVVEILIYLLHRVAEGAVRADGEPHLSHPLQPIGVTLRQPVLIIAEEVVEARRRSSVAHHSGDILPRLDRT